MIFHLQLQFVEPAHLFITAQAGAEQVTASVPIPPDLLRQGRSLSKGARSAVAGSELAQGEMLARLLLSGPVRELLRSSVQAAQARDERLQLALEIADPTLALLPWEWLTLNGRQPWSPALLDDYGLVRSVTSPALVRWSLPRKGPLRVLIAGAEGQQAHCRAIATALRRSLSKQELQALLRQQCRGCARNCAAGAPKYCTWLRLARYGAMGRRNCCSKPKGQSWGLRA
jgi:hypothetical protein